MKEQNNIDKLFSNGLQDFQIEYNQEEVWENIQNEKRKRRGILWIWFSGFVFLAVFTGFLYFGMTDQGEMSSVVQNDIVAQKSEEGKTEKGLEVNYELDSDMEDPEKVVGDTSEPKNVAADLSTPENSRNKASQLVAKNLSEVPRVEQIIKSQSSEINAESEKNQFDTIQNKNSRETDLAVNVGLNVTPAASVVNQENTDLTSSSITLLETSRLQQFQMNHFPWEEQNITALIPTKLDYEKQKFEFQHKSDRFSVAYNASIYRSKTTFSNESSRLEEYLENESNQDMLAYSNQLVGVYKLNDWISISAGLEQMQVFHKFYWEEIQVGTNLSYNENALFTDIEGKITMIGDSTFGFTSKNYIRQSQQILSLYSIPVGFVIRKKWNKWTGGSSLYGILNVSHSFSGFTFNQKYNDTEKREGSKAYFQNNFAASYEIRPYVEYELNEKIGLQLHANLRWNPTRAISDALSVQSMLGGAGIGLRYVIN
ncbi:hypothetical protein N9B82_02175 [Saprospiraceae bacterium]|nr:hypothetical protein [Saprospiraceae bacterium]